MPSVLGSGALVGAGRSAAKRSSQVAWRISSSAMACSAGGTVDMAAPAAPEGVHLADSSPQSKNGKASASACATSAGIACESSGTGAMADAGRGREKHSPALVRVDAATRTQPYLVKAGLRVRAFCRANWCQRF